MPEQKTKVTEEKSEKGNSNHQGSSNKILFWILGGCLALLIITSLVVGAVAYWSYKKVKREIKENQPNFEQWQDKMEKMKEDTEKYKDQTESTFEEEPQVNENSSGDSGSMEFPANTERQMGYIKKVYSRGGKNFLDIDYIQWLTGTVAEKAKREDGLCPSKGECIVENDYYIRNQNPLIRTFEISPNVQITMRTYNMEMTGQIQAQKISSAEFSQIFSSSAWSHLKDAPYIVEISNNQIIRITEQYIP